MWPLTAIEEEWLLSDCWESILRLYFIFKTILSKLILIFQKARHNFLCLTPGTAGREQPLFLHRSCGLREAAQIVLHNDRSCCQSFPDHLGRLCPRAAGIHGLHLAAQSCDRLDLSFPRAKQRSHLFYRRSALTNDLNFYQTQNLCDRKNLCCP